MLYVKVVDITQSVALEDFNYLFHFLDNERQKKILKYKFLNDKKCSLAAGILVRIMLFEIYGLGIRNLTIKKNKFGKPEIAEYPNLYFNLSHSGKYVCCIMGEREVGIDIELLDRNIDIRLFQNIFHEEEYSNIFKMKNSIAQKEIFFSLWTLKESYLKKIGYGLSQKMNTFCIDLRGEFIYLKNKNGFFLSEKFMLYSIDDDYKMAICSEKVGNIDISFCDFQILYKQMKLILNIE